MVVVNPFSKTHGAPSDDERHVGDLGNYKTDGQGNAKGSVEDKHIKLFGQESVLGVGLLFSPSNMKALTLRTSVLLSSMPAPMTLVRAAMRNRRRQATLVGALLVV